MTFLNKYIDKYKEQYNLKPIGHGIFHSQFENTEDTTDYIMSVTHYLYDSNDLIKDGSVKSIQIPGRDYHLSVDIRHADIIRIAHKLYKVEEKKIRMDMVRMELPDRNGSIYVREALSSVAETMNQPLSSFMQGVLRDTEEELRYSRMIESEYERIDREIRELEGRTPFYTELIASWADEDED